MKLIVALRSGANVPKTDSAGVCHTSPITRQLQKSSVKAGFCLQNVYTVSERRMEADTVASALQVLRERPVPCSKNSNAPSALQDSTITVILAFSDTGPHKYHLSCYALRSLLALYSTLSLNSASSQTKSSKIDLVPSLRYTKIKIVRKFGCCKLYNISRTYNFF
jgi:hypothetical protein